MPGLGGALRWELGYQMLRAHLTFSRPFAVICHLFLKIGFCSYQASVGFDGFCNI